MKVLVIDDDFAVRETVKEMLVGAPLEAVFVSDAISGLIALKDNNDINAIVSDYRLPNLGGKDWIDLVRHYHPEKNLILITGYDIAKNNFMDKVTVLKKPFTKYQLLEALGV